MKENRLGLILATVGGGATEFILTNTWASAVIMAVVGAAAGWLTTQLLNWCKKQIFKPKITSNEK